MVNKSKHSALQVIPEKLRESALAALGELEPAGAPRSNEEGRGLILSVRTEAGRSLPSHFLVYFLLVDLLSFPSLGQWEKTAWAVPVRFRGRLYVIEHKKMGIGVFAPNLDPEARMSGRPSWQAEDDAAAIVALVKAAIAVAEPYFRWRAQQAISTSEINVVNNSRELFNRYSYFRDRFRDIDRESQALAVHMASQRESPYSPVDQDRILSSVSLRKHLKWNAQAAIEAFFSWTEHVFIHIAILRGRVTLGTQVAELAEANWSTKFKAALDLEHGETKARYDKLLDIRAQVRNFVAHGAFGKEGQAFSFHSGAGAVPVLLTSNRDHPVSLTGRLAFNEASAVSEIERFLDNLWVGALAPARLYLFSELPSILSYTVDGTYTQAMTSEADMNGFVQHLTSRMEQAADMDW